MKNIVLPVIVAFCCLGYRAYAQKPFMEGMIEYKVKLVTSEGRPFEGKFTFTIKAGRIKKELKLNNGYDYILLINSMNNTIYSLQTMNSKKYAIQLTMAEIEENQDKYRGFSLKEDRTTGRVIAGYTVFKGEVTYTDGSQAEIYFTPDWYPEKSITFDRFPDAKFMPLSYTYIDENGSSMHFEAEKINVLPVENAVFKLPSDYKVISHNEYKQLRK